MKAYNIRTTVISPGAVATELPDSVTDPDAAARVHKFYAEARRLIGVRVLGEQLSLSCPPSLRRRRTSDVGAACRS